MNLESLKINKLYARKEKNQLLVDVLSSAINEVETIELRNNKKLDDTEVASAAKKVISQLKETLEFAKKGQRNELANDCVLKISYLEALLPTQLSDSELETQVENSIISTNALSIKEMGKVIADLKSKFGAALDMTKVSALVKKKLTK